jgi:triacylglycerol lipase
LSVTVVVTATLAFACSGASDEGNQNNGIMGAGGSALPGTGGATMTGGGAPPVGNGGSVTTSSGGTSTSSGGAPPAGGTTSTAGQPSAGGQGAGGQGGGGGGGGGVVTGPDPTSDSASTKGSCTVQTYTQGVAAGQDYVNPTVYYPTDCPAPFPSMALIPGFTEAQNAVNQWGTFLASHGIVVIGVDTAAGGVANTGVQPPSRALGLYEAVTTLKGENTRQGSPLNGKLNLDKMGVMGHSMGGGGTMLAANEHSDLKAAIGLCPWNPGVTYPKNTVPSLFFDGTADVLVAPAAATAEFDSIPASTKKQYVEFNGGSHFVANTPLGAAATDKIVARIGLSWLMVNLVGDSRYQQFIVKDPSMSAFKP